MKISVISVLLLRQDCRIVLHRFIIKWKNFIDRIPWVSEDIAVCKTMAYLFNPPLVRLWTYEYVVVRVHFHCQVVHIYSTLLKAISFWVEGDIQPNFLCLLSYRCCYFFFNLILKQILNGNISIRFVDLVSPLALIQYFRSITFPEVRYVYSNKSINQCLAQT